MSLLAVEQLRVAYGRIRAVQGLDLRVYEGEAVCLIGANGAGKTTTLKALAGLLPAQGAIQFDGHRLGGRPAHEIARLGLTLVPEGRGIFPRMTVLENLQMGAYARRDRHAVKDDLEQVFSLLPRLAERKTQKAGLFSGGEQQMLALGRALMSQPRLLMLDEPSMGLAPVMVQTVFGIIGQIIARGVSLLLVEQNARLALKVCQRGYVLEHGAATLSGPATELAADPAVQAAYLGEV